MMYERAVRGRLPMLVGWGYGLSGWISSWLSNWLFEKRGRKRK